MDDVLVLVGGIIPDEDAAELKRLASPGFFNPARRWNPLCSLFRERAPLTSRSA